MFIADAAYLHKHGKPLIDEYPEAWDNGPCYDIARRHFNDTKRQRRAWPALPADVADLLAAVFNDSKGYTPEGLVHELHDTQLWERVPKHCDHVITVEEMRTGFDDRRLRRLIERGRIARALTLA
jgi:uncharacterized phage-associated protein